MSVPGGIPWYAWLVEYPLLTVGLLLVLVSALAGLRWLTVSIRGGETSWKTKTLTLGTLLAVLVGVAAHWLQTGVLATRHTQLTWTLKASEPNWPDVLVLVEAAALAFGHEVTSVHVVLIR